MANVPELHEIEHCIAQVPWQPEFAFKVKGRTYQNQTGYNKALKYEFMLQGWEPQPKLGRTGFSGDFRKNDIFVEVQFGNSATLFRDYYKFHYGITNNFLWLAVLIVPIDPKTFFPIRKQKDSVSNMAKFSSAKKWFKLLRIPVPIVLIGLLPEN